VATYTVNKEYDLNKGTHVIPYIVNARDLTTSIKDSNGNILYQAAQKPVQDAVIQNLQLPDGCNLILLTYSQVASGNKIVYVKGPDKQLIKKVIPGPKASFILKMAKNSIIILDEAHNASGGDSATGLIAQDMLAGCAGTVFLSGTFAKRPENMALYAQKTAIGEVNSTSEGLTSAIAIGGVAMQEWVSSILVKEGQMIRRERSMENSGATINWITLDETALRWNLPDLKHHHLKTVDTITGVIRQIIAFQSKYVKSAVSELDEELKAQMGEADVNRGSDKAGVDNVPYFSKVFNVINQLLFSTKSEAVAMQAINRLKEGKKVVIAFANTMGSFISELTESGLEDQNGGTRIQTDFSLVLEKALSSVLKIQISTGWGKKQFRDLAVSELSLQGQAEYRRILGVIRQTSTDINVSPIDIIKHLIQSAGYSVAEVTGRNKEVRYDKPSPLGRTGLGRMKMPKTGVVFNRQKEDAAGAFRRFQDNEVDVLLINQSGATGASAHAVPTAKVPANKVKQRVMIVAQPELNVSTEVQKWGRINRTGQLMPPIYDYLVSAVPAEQRPVMMLQNKLRSLFANTTSSQKSSKDILQSSDFLNKIGDDVVREYVELDREEYGLDSIYYLCDLKKWMNQEAATGNEGEGDDKESKEKKVEELAKKVAGRVAIMPTERQKEFYDEVTEAYQKLVEKMINTGEYDLEVEALDLKARLLTEKTLVSGKAGARSDFGEETVLGLYEVANLSKPYSLERVKELLAERIPNGQDGKRYAIQQAKIAQEFLESRNNDRLQELNTNYRKAYEQLTKNAAKAGEDRVEIILAKRDELTKEFEKAYELKETKGSVLIQQITQTMSFFYPGRKLVLGDAMSQTRMVCLGIKINTKARNPYSLGKLYVEFVLASAVRKMSLNMAAKGYEGLTGIIEGDKKNYSYATSDLETFWEKGIAGLSSDRIQQYILTGNLLQGMAQETFNRTRIIDFTLTDGRTSKGLLVPYSVLDPRPSETNQVKKSIKKLIPLIQCVPIIRRQGVHEHIGSDRIKIYGETYGKSAYKVEVPLARARGGDVYLNEKLLKLVEGNNFTSTSSTMVTYVEDRNLEAFCRIISDEIGLLCELSDEQVDMLPRVAKKTQKTVLRDFVPFPVMPVYTAKKDSEDEAKAKRLRLMRMKANALQLRLKLLSV
jgi:hypothetical protein